MHSITLVGALRDSIDFEILDRSAVSDNDFQSFKKIDVSQTHICRCSRWRIDGPCFDASPLRALNSTLDSSATCSTSIRVTRKNLNVSIQVHVACMKLPHDSFPMAMGGEPAGQAPQEACTAA